MKKTKKSLASLAIAGMVLTMVPFNAFATGTVPTRLAGTTAAQTAVAIADQTGWTGTAILASSASYGMVDALTSGPLAKFLKAPILLQEPGVVLNADTKAELLKLKVTKVYVTSGTAVINQAVLNELSGMGISVESLGGNDRIETSVNIAKKMIALKAPVSKVAVAYGWLNQDALSIASIASNASQPILLTEKNKVPASVKEFLAANANITASDVIGGTGVISDVVKAALPNATRHYGTTAYDTNDQVIKDFASSLDFSNVYVANGKTAIDALAGAPLAAVTKSPIVLTDGVNVPNAATFVYSKLATDSVVTALGGTAVVTENVRVGVATGVVTPPEGDLAITSVSVLTTDGHVLAVTFNKAPGSIDATAVKIYETISLERRGVASVEVTDNVAQITLLDNKNSVEIKEVTNYTIEVNGAEFEFMRASFLGADSDARVVAVDFAKKTMKVSFTDQDGATQSTTINVPASATLDLQEALGQEINVWFDANKDLTKYSYKGNTIIYSGIKTTKTLSYDGDEVKTGEIALRETGAILEFANKPLFYNNGSSISTSAAVAIYTENLKVEFAKVVLDGNGKVAYVSGFDWDNVDKFPQNGNPLLVDEVDGTVVVGYDQDYDFEDYTIIKNGKIISMDIIVQGDIVYYNEDNKFAEVYDKTVTGVLEDVYAIEIVVNGGLYVYDNSPTVGGVWVAQYLNEDGDIADFDEDAANQMLDAGEAIVLHFDRTGNVVFVSGKLGEAATASKAAILTTDASYWLDARAKAQMELEYVDSSGDSALKAFAVSDLDKVTVDGRTFEVDKLANTSVPVGAKIDRFALSGSDFKGQFLVALDSESKVIDLATGSVEERGTVGDVYQVYDLATATVGTALEVTTNDEGNVVELEFFTRKGTIVDSDPLESGDEYYGANKINSDTKVFNIEEGTDFDEVTIMNWEDLAEDTTITAGTAYYNASNEVEYFVVSSDNANDTTDFKGLVTKVVYSTDDELVSIKVFVNGTEKTYEVNNVEVPGIIKGNLVTLKVSDSSNVVSDVTIITGSDNIVIGAELDDYDAVEDEVTTSGAITVYDILSDTKVYDATGSTYKLVSLSELTKMEAITDTRKLTIVLDETGTEFVKFIVITN